MKNISQWAKIHPVSSRIIITISHVLLVFNALFSAALLHLYDWETSKWLLPIALILFLIAYLFYPKKNKSKQRYRNFYIVQKVHDFSLVVLYSLIISLGVNNFLATDQDYQSVQPATATFIVYSSAPHSPAVNLKSLKADLKEKARSLRKEIKHELRALKKAIKSNKGQGDENALKVVLTLLTLAVAIFLGYLIAALACNISCSGQEGLAAVVLIGGWLGIVILGIIVIKKIWTKLGVKKEDSLSVA